MAQMSLLRLLQISDSSFPSGAFAFSNGLETLHKENEKFDAGSLYKFPKISNPLRIILRNYDMG